MVSGSRLVIGAGATGRTHRLRTWAAHTDGGGDGAVWLTGSPLRPVSADEVRAAVASGTGVVVADDLQWFAPDALGTLADALISPGNTVTVLASRRPADGTEPAPDALELLTEVLSRTEDPQRLGLFDLDAFGPALAVLRTGRSQMNAGAGQPGAGRSSANPAPRALASAEVEAIHRLTGGSIGLAADLLTTGWDMERSALGHELIDAVQARIRRAGPAAVELVRVWSVIDPDDTDDGLVLAHRALAGHSGVGGYGPGDNDDPRGHGADTARADTARVDTARADTAERAIRAGGLLGSDGELIPLVRLAAEADMTSAQRAACHDRLAAVLAPDDLAAAARHLLWGEGRIPDAPRILADAAIRASLSAPQMFDRLVDRATQVGLPGSEASVLRALGAFHLGSPRALAHLEAARIDPAPDDGRVAQLGYGLDLRELRFAAAAQRPLTGPLAGPLPALARALDGRLAGADVAVPDVPAEATAAEAITAATPIAERAPLAYTAGLVVASVVSMAEGRTRDATNGFVQAADDYDRLAPTAALGFTPHGVGSLAALLIGDLPAVEHLCGQAITHHSGGPGEALFHQLVRAYARLARGDYRTALDLLRRPVRPPSQWTTDDDGDEINDALDFGHGDRGWSSAAGLATSDATGDPTGIATVATAAAGSSVATLAGGGGASSLAGSSSPALLCQRDRLVLAALEAAIARRSGDTGRLRSAWASAEQALLRPSVSWLLTDVFTELLSAGARLGDRRRVEPIADELVRQCLDLPPSGPGPTAGLWLRLQVALAFDDGAEVAATASRMASFSPTDERSQARVAAAAMWARVVARTADEAEVAGVAATLSAVHDGWEASRLLGQAALDEGDPRAARRLLELARVSASEPVEHDGDDALAGLGLSDREAEVALMVAEGKTHKEIGAQLFISPKTVEHHVAKIRQKLGANSRAELLATIRSAVGQS